MLTVIESLICGGLKMLLEVDGFDDFIDMSDIQILNLYVGLIDDLFFPHQTLFSAIYFPLFILLETPS